ncbi:MAG: hypothetical protein ACK4FR_11535 [Tabrizicola sp.]
MRLALASLAFAGLATASCALTPEIFPQLTLPGGEPTRVPGTDITLTLTEVEDQRCPAGVDCFWEGIIRVRLSVMQDGAIQEITLCNRCADNADLATAAGQTFGLIGLAPSTDQLAKLGRAPELTDYTATVNYGPAD